MINEATMTTVGERIRHARTARKPRWSQQVLADALSVARWGRPGFCHRHEVYRWEAGLRLPTVWLPYLEQVLSIDPHRDPGLGRHGRGAGRWPRTSFGGALSD
jgi:hypothetical protein